ncbi:hypothetical protein [Rhodoligotrophos defluvii]|uniref:hypothetical protein n=1 Tax=Rhodoligotrophos defluvii TaxID=2561934 RepID=UPI0010CA03BD|nr:hypothetical protein [Rhodoligotrophos defluvii]
MKYSVIFAGAVALLLTASTAQADSWSRSWIGPNGASRSVSGHCSGGVCDRHVHSVGPDGASRSKTSRCGPYGCSRHVTTTGPGGATWSRSSRVVHGPYRSYRYSRVTGPAGNTYVTRRVWRHW